MTCSSIFLKYPLAVLVQTPATYILMYCHASSTDFSAVRCFQFRKKVCSSVNYGATLSLSTAQQTIRELRSQEARDWVIPRDEIQITEKCLGRGGWGSVNGGTYCSCTVAVKQIHELILSPHNINLFQREMNIASKCCHPHLL